MQLVLFIGLGAMGAPMAKRVVSAGFGLSVFNVHPEKVEPLVKLGARSAGSPRAAAEGRPSAAGWRGRSEASRRGQRRAADGLGCEEVEPPRNLVSTSEFASPRSLAASRRAEMLPAKVVRDLLVGSLSSVVVVGTFVIRPFVVGRRAKDVEVAVEVDVDLAAVVLGDFDLIVALFVADLGARNPASVGVIEREALRLLDAGSRGLLLRGVVAGAGSISHACPDEQQYRDRRRYQSRLHVSCS